MASRSRRASASANTICAELAAIERAVASRTPCPKRVRRPRRGRGAGRDGLARQRVGVDRRDAELLELRRARSSCRWRSRRSAPIAHVTASANHADRPRACSARGAACFASASRSSAGRRRRAPASARRRPRPTSGCTSPTSDGALRSNDCQSRVAFGGRATATTAASVTRLMPTSITVAPGLTKSRVTSPGRPTAATRMSARAADRRAGSASANGRS